MSEENCKYVYVASVLFWQPGWTNDYPAFATSDLCSGIQAFIDRCYLTASNRKEFNSSNVSINAIEVKILPDGTVIETIAKVKKFRNANANN